MKSLHLLKLQNSEHLALMTDVLKLLTDANLSEMETLKTQFSEKVSEAEAAQKQIRKSQHTDQLAMLDQKRDNLYRGLVLRLQSEEFSLIDDRKKAAEKVALVIKTYGNLTVHNYQKETIEIQNFVRELKSENYLPSVQKIGLDEWIEWLETTNTEFEKLYASRRDEYAAQPTYDMKNIRKELDALFKKIQQTAEALAILKPSEALSVFMAKVDASISKWRDILAQRSASRSTKTENEKE